MRKTIPHPKRSCTVILDYLPVYSSGACAAQINPIFNLSLEPEEAHSLLPGAVQFRIPEIAYQAMTLVRPTSPVSPAGRLPPFRLEPSIPPHEVEVSLEATTCRIAAHLEVFLDDSFLAKVPISLLPGWKWPHVRETRTVAAAYVLPEDETVRRITVEAGLLELSPSEPLREPGPAGLPVRDSQRSLYNLLSQKRILYEDPYLENDEWCGCSYQTLRSPDEILGDSGTASSRGTCMDLALLMASCLESVGHQPVLIFTGGPEEAPRHALLGCWSRRSTRFRPMLTDSAELRRRVATGELLVCETTGVCQGWDLSFEQASAAGQGRLADPAGVHAVDIAACRPPPGRVRPIQLPYEPPVRNALLLGQGLARSLGSRNRETVHLLYGLCAGRGELTSWLLAECGSSPQSATALLAKTLLPEGCAGVASPTRNYELCLALARSNARRRGKTAVAEGDLLWAVLETPSRNVRRVLAGVGCSLEGLISALGRRWPRPGDLSLSRAPRSDATS